MKSCIFGPVPSRRLGVSLGIDLVPYKTCSFDCIYCECGKTTNLTNKRKIWISTKQAINDIKIFFENYKGDPIDIFTFSGSGEPTLAENIGEIIEYLKINFSKIPIAVLTNASLFNDINLRKDLLKADIIIPSLDTVTEKIFNKLDRNHPAVCVNNIIEGLKKLRDEYRGKIWLEILFVKDYNDSEIEIKKLLETVGSIGPDKIQLNTCVRPGSERDIKSLSEKELANIYEVFFNAGFDVEIISSFQKQIHQNLNIDNLIEMISRRPCSIEDIVKLTGLRKIEILKKFDLIKLKGLEIYKNKVDDHDFYYIKN